MWEERGASTINASSGSTNELMKRLKSADFAAFKEELVNVLKQNVETILNVCFHVLLFVSYRYFCTLTSWAYQNNLILVQTAVTKWVLLFYAWIVKTIIYKWDARLFQKEFGKAYEWISFEVMGNWEILIRSFAAVFFLFFFFFFIIKQC